jgi:hypothetical protein
MEDGSRVAEGSLEPSKREIANNSQSGRCKAEGQMGGDSFEDILRSKRRSNPIHPAIAPACLAKACYGNVMNVFAMLSVQFAFMKTSVFFFLSPSSFVS